MKLTANPYFSGLQNMAALALGQYVERKGIRIPQSELRLLWQIAWNPSIPRMTSVEHPDFEKFQKSLLDMLAAYPDETLDVLTYVRRKLKEWRANPKGTQRIKVLNFFATHNALVDQGGKLYAISDSRLKNQDLKKLKILYARNIKGLPRLKDKQIASYLGLGISGALSVKEIRRAIYGATPHLPDSMTR